MSMNGESSSQEPPTVLHPAPTQITSTAIAAIINNRFMVFASQRCPKITQRYSGGSGIGGSSLLAECESPTCFAAEKNPSYML